MFLRLLPVAGGTAVLAWRIRETRVPVTASRIVVPPLAMSTGFLMFLVPTMRIPWWWLASAFATGFLVLSYPLGRTSTLERRGRTIVMRRTNRFILVIGILFGVRLVLHEYIETLISVRQTASLFFVLAFGMIVRWRAGLYRSYRRLAEGGAS